MEWWLTGLLMFCGLFGVLLAGVPVGFSLLLVATVVNVVMWGPDGFVTMAATAFSSLVNYLLLAAPFFVIMGECAAISGLGADLFKTFERWFGHWPGGLGIATIWTSTVFGATTGFSGTAIAAFGPVALPEMFKRNYHRGLALGAMGGGSALGVLIPPSVPLLMYGFLTGTSVSRLFIAGVIPGIAGAILFSLFLTVLVTLKPSFAPPSPRSSWVEKITTTLHSFPFILLIGCILGTLWFGIATPTEAAGLGALVGFILLPFYRKFNWTIIRNTFSLTTEMLGRFSIIIMGALAFTQTLSFIGFVDKFSTLVAHLDVPPWCVVALMMVANIFFGCFLDTMGVLFLTVPIYVPIIRLLDYNLIWFGILITINTEIGCLTPPVAMNIYFLRTVTPDDVTMWEIIKGVSPYWGLYLLLLIIIALVPQIALWLPGILQ